MFPANNSANNPANNSANHSARIYPRRKAPARRVNGVERRTVNTMRQITPVRGPDFSEVIEELVPLRDALRTISANNMSLSECLDLYIANYYKSEMKTLAIELFSRFYNVHRKRLSGHLSALSDLAAIFVDEEDFIGDYKKVCYDIQQIVKMVNANFVEHGVSWTAMPLPPTHMQHTLPAQYRNHPSYYL